MTELCDDAVDDSDLLELFGSPSALTDRYRVQMRRVGAVLGCCSPALCRRYGLPGDSNCTIDELPYLYNGVYYDGFFDGPLSASAQFAAAWMLQTLSGFGPVAWGELNVEEVAEIYRLHERVMVGCTRAPRRTLWVKSGCV